MSCSKMSKAVSSSAADSQMLPNGSSAADSPMPLNGSSAAGSRDSPMPLNGSSAAGSRMLPNDIAAETLQRFNPRDRRCLLAETVVGTFNRPISPEYVHHRLRTILEIDGFTKLRYGQAIALERTSADPSAGARFELVSQNYLAAAFLL